MEIFVVILSVIVVLSILLVLLNIIRHLMFFKEIERLGRLHQEAVSEFKYQQSPWREERSWYPVKPKARFIHPYQKRCSQTKSDSPARSGRG